ncbi:MAG: hydrogenase iron-sulfur subunit [Dethiobacteria bacterium]|jgi:F420-non-reducing hydrogenase iron-sulfur subunit|nr:hydrogenase iron-sulfur subunit [Bacillota bacterium]
MSVTEKSLQEKQAWEPLIVAFCCNWCSYAGGDLAGTSRMPYPANIRVIRVPCSSRVNPMMVLRAFQRGADGVLVAGCHPGDCHYTSGNYYTRRRMSVFRRLLEYTGIEPERFQVTWISGSEGAKFAQVMNRVTEEVRALGPNRKLRDAR